ncbi:MAG: hypothetical protein MZV65_53935 [Chromatiales bacterium]|nr:hypothetical protein [Chromatiales bacterium]
MDASAGLLARLEYPGRARRDRRPAAAAAPAVILYAITGRSASSQARKLVFRDGGDLGPADRRGDPAARATSTCSSTRPCSTGPAGVAVSNGKQTADIRDGLAPGRRPGGRAVGGPVRAGITSPTPPSITPRHQRLPRPAARAALSVVRRGAAGESLRSYFEVGLRPGEGASSPRTRAPTPTRCRSSRASRGPLVVRGRDGAPRPPNRPTRRWPRRRGGKDFRVAVACVLVPLAGPAAVEVRIINRVERT